VSGNEPSHDAKFTLVTERQPITRRLVQRAKHAERRLSPADPDEIAVEEPLEIRIASDVLATIMRTPGEDHYLAAGFLHGEGIIRGLADLGRVAHCGRPTDPGYGNLIDIAPGPGTVLAPELTQTSRRGTVVSSACGICGRERIDDLLTRLGRITHSGTLAATRISESVVRLQTLQTGYARTGAMHGALALTRSGEELAVGEDVGRHNAVDKVVGKLLYAGLLGPERAVAELLVVSGRTSFEIVQKAAAARFAFVISVSAPTSLAIDLAAELGITLVGFARQGTFNLYTHAQRVDPLG
jgi:FdhD protein